MSTTYDENGMNAQQLIQLVEDMGYDCTEWETAVEQPEKPASSKERIVQIQFGGIASKHVYSTLC
jgi:hypothetical protein